VYSGDGSPASHTLGTYNSLFPRGAYFTPKAIPFLGTQNLIDLHPVAQFQLKKTSAAPLPGIATRGNPPMTGFMPSGVER